MVVFNPAHLIGKAQRRRDLHLIFRLVLPVAPLALGLPILGHGHGTILGELGDIVQNALFIEEVPGIEFPRGNLPAEAEGDAGVDHGLALERVLEEVHRHVDVGEHVEVWEPVEERAGLLPVGGGLLHLPHQLAMLKVEVVAVAVPADHRVKVLRGVLGGAGAQAVETQGIFIVSAGVVLVLAAGVELAEHQLPVVPSLGLVPVHGAAPAEILHFDGVVEIAGDDDGVAVPLPRLVDGVRENFKHRVLAALQAVGAEDHRRTLAHPVGALEGRDGVVAIGLLFRHKKPHNVS